MKKLATSSFEFEGMVWDVKTLLDEEDASLPAWEDGAELAVVGKATPRIDGLLRVSGRAIYTVDVQLPRMLHAAVLRSPYAHARVSALDLDAARRTPGVRAVVGPDDGFGTGSSPLSSEPLFAGAPIAAVAAETEDAARAGIEALRAQLEQLSFDVDLETALRELRFTTDPEERGRGEPEALAAADTRIEVEVETPFHIQSPLEPHAAVADWQPEHVTVWASTQEPFAIRDAIAKQYELHPTQVRVRSEYVGGGFGSKLGSGEESLLAVELSRLAGRPVRVVFTRHEEQQVGGHRPATRQTVRLGARPDGALVAGELEAVVGVGAKGGIPGVRIPILSLYAIENVQASTFPVRLNLRPANAFRAPGVVEGTTALEQAVDELAAAVGLDPFELRRRAHAETDPASGKPYSAKSLLACYERAAALAGWDERDTLRERSSDGLLRGMGCASQLWFGIGGPPAHCTIRLGGDGVAHVVTGIQDIGTGTLTSAQLVAAEELGIPLGMIRVSGGDTGTNVYGPAAGGSATTASVMPAVRAAAARVRRTVLELASDLFEVGVDDLILRDGRISSRDRALDEPYTSVTEHLGNATIDGSGSRGINETTHFVRTWGCQIAQVAVDPDLGRVIVERIWAVHDVGRIVNPLLAASQVEGGVLQGLGYALFEERVVDPTTGAPTNANFDDYKVPTIADTPEIVVEFIDHPDPFAANTGAKGLGEPPIIPTAAAIANAFAHATGRRCNAIPLTPARVLEALA